MPKPLFQSAQHSSTHGDQTLGLAIVDFVCKAELAENPQQFSAAERPDTPVYRDRESNVLCERAGRPLSPPTGKST